jgi:hypothetical protein
METHPDARRILDAASRAMAAIREDNIPDRLNAVATASAELHRIGNSAAVGDLAEMAAGYGLAADDIQAALIRGINRDLDRRLDDPPPPPKPATRRKGRAMKFKRLADIQREPVSWLWPDRIARKLVLFTGPPDCGKTTASIDIVARVTKGAAWPDGSGFAPLGNVIFMTAEDGLADTIRTRADAAGADVTRVHCLDTVTDENGMPSVFDLGQDLVLLAEHMKEIGDVALVVIDPISAYMGAGKIDTHKTSDVRAVLTLLRDFADKHSVAVLGLTHPSKSVTRAMNAATGSGGFVAAARATWLFTRELDEEGQETGRTLMLPIKNNLSDKRNNGISYRLASFDFGGGVTAPYVMWDEAVSITADQALAMTLEPPTGGTSGDGSALAEAITFLTDEFMMAERIEASELVTWAKNAGISEKTLRTARSRLGVVTKREGFGPKAKYYLSLPRTASMDAS